MGDSHSKIAQLGFRRHLLDEAIRAETAMNWLLTYGPRSPQGTKESIGATVTINYASACFGAKEAAYFLEAAIGHLFPEIRQKAIQMATTAIEEAARCQEPQP